MVSKKRKQEMLNNLQKMTTAAFSEWLHVQEDGEDLYDALRKWYVSKNKEARQEAI